MVDAIFIHRKAFTSHKFAISTITTACNIDLANSVSYIAKYQFTVPSLSFGIVLYQNNMTFRDFQKKWIWFLKSFPLF